MTITVELQAKTIDDALSAALPLIREKSRGFYEREIRREFAETGRSLVDRHAGNGRYLLIVQK